VLDVTSSLALDTSLADGDGDGDVGALPVSARNVAPALVLGDALLEAEEECESDVVAELHCERVRKADGD
jgi:hypothetical protein